VAGRNTAEGQFARDGMREWSLGMPMLCRLRRTATKSEMEQTGCRWRQEFGT